MWIVLLLFQLRNQAISFTKELYETQQTHHAIEVNSFSCVTAESEWPFYLQYLPYNDHLPLANFYCNKLKKCSLIG